MKRSEMIEHIAQELIDIAVDEKSHKTAYQGYFQRKAADLLDMIEGFGMLPPPRDKFVEASGIIGPYPEMKFYRKETVNE